jgi:hypothetical protein
MPPYNSTSWKELVSARASDAEFEPPGSEADLADVEQQLKVHLPLELRELLLEFNGLKADYGSNVIWSIRDIQSHNSEFRSKKDLQKLYMPFDHLLFFGDDGGGDQFAFAIHADGIIHNLDIFRWNHEIDSRSWFAGRLEQYLERRLIHMVSK